MKRLSAAHGVTAPPEGLDADKRSPFRQPRAELALHALRAEHRQVVVSVEVGPPLGGVLFGAWLLAVRG